MSASDEEHPIAPQELIFRFNEGQTFYNMTPQELAAAIQIVRAGGDDLFGNANDVVVQYGYIGIGERPNEIVVRFREGYHCGSNLFGPYGAIWLTKLKVDASAGKLTVVDRLYYDRLKPKYPRILIY